MILIHRIERVARTVLVDGVGRIAGIVPIGGVKRVRWIIGVDRIQRIVRCVSAGGSKDVVVPLIPRIKTHVGIARCGPHQNQHDQQHRLYYGRLLAISSSRPSIPDDCDIGSPF